MTGGWSSKPEWPSVNKAPDWPNAGDGPEINVPWSLEDLKITKVYNNKMPTHDPYTNPNAQVYYECKCGAILDPGTKSFAALNNAASDKGWKVRWRSDGMGYEPFCVECGKDVPE